MCDVNRSMSATHMHVSMGLVLIIPELNSHPHYGKRESDDF